MTLQGSYSAAIRRCTPLCPIIAELKAPLLKPLRKIVDSLLLCINTALNKARHIEVERSPTGRTNDVWDSIQGPDTLRDLLTTLGARDFDFVVKIEIWHSNLV